MKTATLLMFALLFSGLRSADAQEDVADRADRPSARTDAVSMAAHAELLDKARRGRTDIYFVGDSIIRRWGATDYPELLENWKRNFFGWNAADFGWGADRIQNILWRLENGELDGVNPKIVVLLAGTNNVGDLRFPGSADDRAADAVRGIDAILKTLRSKAPGAVIIMTGIFPRNDNMSFIPIIERINAELEKRADGKTIRWLNINDKLADSNGRLFEGMTGDKLHPSLKAYQIWADSLRPLFTELLGPPAKEDHAPPPTGVPAAAAAPAK